MILIDSKKVLNADLDLFNHFLPKKYIKVSRKKHDIKYPVFKFRYFYCKRVMGRN